MLKLRLHTSGNRICGTGEVLLIAYRFPRTNLFARQFSYAGRGWFNHGTQQSVVHLRGLGKARGSSFIVRANGSFDVQKIRGRLLGQRMNAEGPFEILPWRRG